MTERVGKPMDFVYVIFRADGAHKIGVTGDVSARRATLSRMMAARFRPLLIVAQYNLGMVAPLIEKVAHAEMLTAGYAPIEYEWFNASRDECIAAIERAIRLIDEIGPDEWRRRRVNALAKKKRKRHGTQSASSRPRLTCKRSCRRA